MPIASETSAEDLPTTLPVYSEQEVADYLRTGFWTWFGDKPHSFNLGSDGLGANDGVLFYNVSGWATDPDGLTEGGAELARAALQLYGNVLGVTFAETTSTGNEVDLFFSDNVTGAGTGYTWVADSAGTVVDYAWVSIGASWLTRFGDGIGSYTLQTYIHEIGHALGLGHAGGYDSNAVYVTDSLDPDFSNNSNVYLNDSWQMSIMSYFDQRENTSVDASYARLLTPMMADWIALGDMGSYTISAFADDTVYGFNTTITSAQSVIWNSLADYASSNAFNIIDSGGIDTIDLSGYVADQTIVLWDGAASDVGGLRGNMTISPGTVIENAIGGAGNDRIEGNAADNILFGMDGKDFLYGGEGNDELHLGPGGGVAKGGPGDDRLFTDGTNDGERLYGGSGDDQLYVFGAFGENDIFDGGPGTDTLTFDLASAITVDLGPASQGVVSMTGGGAPMVVMGVERVSAGSGNDTLHGDDGVNSLEGGAGDDIVNGDKGRDLLDGGAGNDRLFGGDDDDRMIGGTGDDRMVGGEGADIMRGGSGDDTYVVNDAGDEVVEYSGNGIDCVISRIDFSLRLQAENVENLELAGSARVGNGSGLDNVLVGNGGDNVLRGRSGDDDLTGGRGNDRLVGGFGEDVFRFFEGDGRDVIVDFDPAMDRIHFHGGAAGFDELTIGQAGSVALVEYGAGDQIRLLGLDADALTEDLFFF